MKSETLFPVKDSRRKSDDAKISPPCKDYGFFKYRSYVETPSSFTTKTLGLSDSSENLQPGIRTTLEYANNHNIARQSNSLSNIVSNVKRYEKSIQSRKVNDQSIDLGETTDPAVNDNEKVMEELLRQKMSAETTKTIEHVGPSGDGSFMTSLPRANSVDSNCSIFSIGLSQKAESISDLSTTVCKCDDCLLGITDALADLVLWNSSNTIQYGTIDENSEIEKQENSSLTG